MKNSVFSNAKKLSSGKEKHSYEEPVSVLTSAAKFGPFGERSYFISDIIQLTPMTRLLKSKLHVKATGMEFQRMHK